MHVLNFFVRPIKIKRRGCFVFLLCIYRQTADNKIMSTSTDFENELYAAAEAKTTWYDMTVLPKLVDDYRNYREVFNTLLSMLLKKGLVQSDPYKLDKKVTQITVPAQEDFKDSEKATALGVQLSEYESSLEFLCNYFKFSIETLTLSNIKKLMQLNTFISWNSLMGPAAKQTSRVLGELFTTIKVGSDVLSVSVVNDSINFISKNLSHINSILKDVTDFRRELYKVDVRRSILDSDAFAPLRASMTCENGTNLIRKHFSAAMNGQPFYTELIEEIVREEAANDKEARRQAVLEKIGVKEQKVEKKQAAVDTKQLLISAFQLFAALVPQYTHIAPKIEENHSLLQSEHHGFFEKFKAVFRKAFNVAEQPIEYKLKITDPFTQTVKNQTVQYNSFIENLMKRIRLYTSFGMPRSANIQKMMGMEEAALLDYLDRQLGECHNVQLQLEGFDEFFKTAVNTANRSKVKGIQIELTAIKNSLIKINQRKAEYTAYISEQEQMRKLGITNG